MCVEGLDPGGRHSYCLLLTNYGGIMAIPTDPPYCLVYPIVYLCQPLRNVHTCLHCCTLLQHVDMEPFHQRTFEGSCLIIPYCVQYRTLFLEIVALCNHRGPLIDPDMNDPFPLFTVGDFCLKDKIFPGTYGDSLLFMKSDLTKLKKKDICVPPYKEEKTEPATPKESRPCLTAPRRASPHPPTGWRSPTEWKKLTRQSSLTRPVAELPWPPHHSFQTPPVVKSHPRRDKPLQPRRG